MKYDKEKIHHFVEKIPQGKIITPSMIAEALGLNPSLYQRCVGQEICNCKAPEKYRVILKSGWRFPHQDDQKDCKKRTKILRKEGISVAADNKRVLNAIEFLYIPKKQSTV